MSSFGKDCPQCGQNNAAYAVRCRCGYSFSGEPDDTDVADTLSAEEEALYLEYLMARAGQASSEAQKAQTAAANSPNSREKGNLAKQAQSAAERARAELEAAKAQFATTRSRIQGALQPSSPKTPPAPSPAAPLAASPSPAPKPVQPQPAVPISATSAPNQEAPRPVAKPAATNESTPEVAPPAKPIIEPAAVSAPAKELTEIAAAPPTSPGDTGPNAAATSSGETPKPRQTEVVSSAPSPISSASSAPAPAAASTNPGTTSKSNTTGSPPTPPSAPTNERAAAARSAAIAQVKLLEATLARLRAAKHAAKPQDPKPHPPATPKSTATDGMSTPVPAAAAPSVEPLKQPAEPRPRAKVNGTHAHGATAADAGATQSVARPQAPGPAFTGAQLPPVPSATATADPTKKECPNCTAVLPAKAERCRCGFKFATVEESMPSLSLSDNELDAIGTDLGYNRITHM